jgi:hypothetical protein
LPKSAILTVIFSLPSSTPASSGSALPGSAESTAMPEGGGSVGCAIACGFDPERRRCCCCCCCFVSACCVSSDGPGGCAGCGELAFSPNPSVSSETFENASAARSAESIFFLLSLSIGLRTGAIISGAAAPAPASDEGLLLGASVVSFSILLMLKDHLSSMVLLPKDEDGEGRGWEPVM